MKLNMIQTYITDFMSYFPYPGSTSLNGDRTNIQMESSILNSTKVMPIKKFSSDIYTYYPRKPAISNIRAVKLITIIKPVGDSDSF